MKNYRLYFLPVFLVLLTFSLSGCEVVGDIFKAGMWTGLIGVVLVVLLVLFLIRKMRG
ncbi:hypothetical protein [Hymenobacter chitinivorans]|uniref:Phosphatidate cytidylyltransferase n=1 Tax=Hymenobacter chitinivorans DSM 11115 TaxID=1121954 RepID=A0A2M9B5A8_9BACT|nr:hypothetical protein [Hymenobacter chitinivorans]PJJ53130.1 hypothetical protein CLV45_3788 [Hymenobacter chitinivorans DSM 11115]